MKNFSLRQLRYFVAFVENGGVAQAARMIHISQPSISSAIKELEAEFGIRLFFRHRTNGTSLTPAGKLFYQHALELLKQARDFHSKVAFENGAVAGELTIGCFETLAPMYAPVLMASFQHAYPQVSVHLHVASHTKLLDGLRKGIYDMAICYAYELPGDIDSTALLADLVPHALVPPEHRFAEMAEVSLSMLAAEPLVLLDIWPSNEYFLGLFERAGLSPRLSHKAPSLELVRGLVAHGLGVSVLVSEPASGLTYDGLNVVSVPIQDAMQPSRTVLAWHGSDELPPLSKTFVEHSRALMSTDAQTAGPAA
ncbi:MAG TPA: LysR substrate-binding domain-containing protein [Pseudorhodoferax sp.]|jgi:DNA-binding transcriptional LysR family regulator|nr:LysR substrate-binding domain-containing protein [Pseudorhodoferax sp.]